MKIRFTTITLTILFISFTHTRVLTKSNKLKDDESSVSIESNVDTRVQTNKVVQEPVKSNVKDNESMTNESSHVSSKSKIVQSHPVDASNKSSEEVSRKSVEAKILPSVTRSVHSSHKTSAVSELQKENVVVEVRDAETSNKLSNETSSFKTDPSMKDYDINATESQANKSLSNEVAHKEVKSQESSSHNSDVIEDTVVNKGTQVLSEKSDMIEEESTSVTESRDASEGLKIASAFVGVVTLIAML
jgi:hypothetical protein